MSRPTVFISYSWDSEEHREWVLNLSNDLIEKFGINVLLDQYELSAGKEMTYFMESSIEKSDKVLLILTPNYKLKAENRTGGVGFEYSMISQELFEIQTTNNKFIPILRIGDLNTSSPKYIKTKIYLSMDNDSKYSNQLFELARIIYEKPKILKPPLGDIPDFTNDEFDPVLELVKDISKQKRLNTELNLIVKSPEGFSLANSEIDNLHNRINEKAELYSSKSEFKFKVQTDYPRKLILSSGGYSVYILWSLAYSDSLDNSKLIVSFWKGYLTLDSHSPMYTAGNEPKRIKLSEYEFDLNLKKEIIWKKNDKTEKTTNDLVKESFSYILDEIRKENIKKFRN